MLQGLKQVAPEKRSVTVYKYKCASNPIGFLFLISPFSQVLHKASCWQDTVCQATPFVHIPAEIRNCQAVDLIPYLSTPQSSS